VQKSLDQISPDSLALGEGGRLTPPLSLDLTRIFVVGAPFAKHPPATTPPSAAPAVCTAIDLDSSVDEPVRESRRVPREWCALAVHRRCAGSCLTTVMSIFVRVFTCVCVCVHMCVCQSVC